MPESSGAGKRKVPTIYDVARKAGVSIATVSRVLNSPTQVSDETFSKVLAAIDELGFVPKAEASARARKAVGRIGVLTPFFTSPSFVQRMRGVASTLADTPYELVIYPVDSLGRLNHYLSMLPATRRLDGLIVAALPIGDTAADRLVKNELETVLIEFHHPSFSSVEIDDYLGGRLAAQHLLDKGYSRCAFVSNDELPDYSLYPENLRLAGYKETLLENGLSLPDSYVKLLPLAQRQARQPIHELLDLPEPPTAVFAATDELAMRVLRVARERGLEVPNNLAVVGFDDLDIAEYVGLTTVRQPLDESGRTAAELLLARLGEPSRPRQHVRLSLTLVERETA